MKLEKYKRFIHLIYKIIPQTFHCNEIQIRVIFLLNFVCQISEKVMPPVGLC